MIRRGKAHRRLPMQACRVVRRDRFVVERGEVIRVRLEKILSAEADAYARRHGWGPVVRGGDIWAERPQSPDSPATMCVWGVEVARGADGKALMWPATRSGLRDAIAWCDMKNRSGSDD